MFLLRPSCIKMQLKSKIIYLCWVLKYKRGESNADLTLKKQQPTEALRKVLK